MTKYPDLFAALAAPFENHEVKTRPGQGGIHLHYITARTVMNRLDNVLGPEGWWDEFVPLENSVICKLTIRLPDDSTVTKSDAGGYAGMTDSGDDDKSGFSDAFKRAATKFGISRYLYRDGGPTFLRDRKPAPAGADPGDPQDQGLTGPGPAPPGQESPPRSGKALYACTREQEQRHEVGLLKYLNGWARLQEFPGRMVDWDTEQVSLAYAEACRKLQDLSSTPTT